MYQTPSAAAVWVVFSASLASYLAIGIASGGHWLAMPVALVLLPVALLSLLAARTSAEDLWRGLVDALALRRPSAAALVAGGLAGSSLWVVTASLLGPVAVELDPQRSSELTRAWAEFAGWELMWKLVVLPAVCEEIAFRGLLANGLAGRGAVFATVTSSVAFAVVHVAPAQILLTFPLGVALAAITLASRSVWPAVVAHGLNNIFALMLATGRWPALSDAVSANAAIALTVAGCMLCGSAWILWLENQKLAS